MQTRNGTGPAYSEGLAASFNVTVALDAFLVGIAETSPDTSAIVLPPDTGDADTLAWTYQTCTEFGTISPFPTVDLRPGLITPVYIGFFQGANPNNNRSIQSQFLTQAQFQQDCLDTFPEGAVPPVPNVHVLNDAYGGWHMNPTHVFFTDGQIDPWRTLSIASFEENAPKRIGNIVIPA